MKKLLTILLVLISFSSFAQFEAGEYINSDTVKIDGVPLLLNTFKQGGLGGAGNIFYSTGASSQPASGSLAQLGIAPAVEGGYLPRVGGSMLNTTMVANLNAEMISGYKPSDLIPVITRLHVDDSTSANISGSFQSFDYNTSGSGLLGSIISFGGFEDRNYNTQIQSNYDASSIKFRTAQNYVWGSWREFWQSGNSNISTVDWNAKQYISHVPTGTPPLVVASTTKVDSLNAGLLDGKQASDFQLKSDTLTFDATLSDLQDSSAAIRALANTKAMVSGTVDYIMKKTGANTIGNSSIIDNGSLVSTSLPFSSTISLSSPTHYAGTSFFNSNFFELGYGQTGNRYAVIDLTGDDTYTDYGLRLIRGNTGPDAISQILHRGKGAFAVGAQDAASVYFTTKNTVAMTIDTLQNSGFGTTTPAARIHSQSTGTQLRLGYDATKYTDLSTGSTGNLTIDPTGDTVKVVGAVNSTGGFFKNGVEITGGAGSMVYPLNSGIVTYNGTTWGTSITNNSNLWNNAYDKKIVSAAFSGTSTKTLTLYQQDGNVLQAAFADESGGSYTLPTASTSTLGGVKIDGTTVTINSSGVISASGTSKWTADTYGINYQSGNVGVGSVSSSSAHLTVGSYSSSSISGIVGLSNSEVGVSGASYTNIGISGASNSNIGVKGISGSSFGGDFTGLGCRATKFYVSSLNIAPTSATATGTTGEIRFTSDYIYVCVATNTWKRTQISTW